MPPTTNPQNPRTLTHTHHQLSPPGSPTLTHDSPPPWICEPSPIHTSDDTSLDLLTLIHTHTIRHLGGHPARRAPLDLRTLTHTHTRQHLGRHPARQPPQNESTKSGNLHPYTWSKNLYSYSYLGKNRKPIGEVGCCESRAAEPLMDRLPFHVPSLSVSFSPFLWLSIYLPTYLPTYLPIYLSIYLQYLRIYLPS